MRRNILFPPLQLDYTKILVAVGLGSFAFALQSAAILVALPSMSVFLRGMFSIESTVTVYLFSITASLLLCGRLGDSFGNRRIYLLGLVLFTVGSCICGFAGGSAPFLMSRSLQGVGAALSAANSPAILTRWVPPKRHGQGFGWQATFTYVGLCIGPVTASLLIWLFDWRSIFIAEIPVGMAAIFLAFQSIPADDSIAGSRMKVPILSGLAWLACLLPLLALLTQGAHWGWTSPRVFTSIVLCGSAVVCLVLCETFNETPLVGIRLFCNPEIFLSLACELLFYFSIYMIGFFVPLNFSRGNSPGAVAAGLILSIEGIARLLGASAAGSAADRHGPLPVAIAGSALLVAGSLLFRFGGSGAPTLMFCAGGFLVGLGAGIFIPANSLRLFANVPRGRHGVAAGVFATIRNLGMMTGMASAAALTLVSGNGTRVGFSVIVLVALSILSANLTVGVWASDRFPGRRTLAYLPAPQTFQPGYADPESGS